jgi:hypothetical protein
MEARLGNVSTAWAWLNQRDDMDHAAAAELFTPARLTTVVREVEETVERVIAVTRTTSMYLTLDSGDRRRLEEGLAAVVDGSGGSYPMRLFYVLVTAQAAG